jgi:hypothetical protein
MNDFLDGKIYMNRLSYFRKIEEDSENNRADPKEGLSAWWQPEEVILEVNGRRLTDFAAPIEIRLNNSDNLHVFCLFAGATDASNLCDETKLAEIKSDFSVSKECAELGDYYVLVHNSAAFIERMVKAVKESNFLGNAGLVNYYDPTDFSGEFYDRAVFNKHNNYKHQKEYRFAVDTQTAGGDALVLNIGDIRDIASISSTWDIKIDLKFSVDNKSV